MRRRGFSLPEGDMTVSDTELCYLPAAEALRLFRRKKLSPVELMEATIRRAEAVQPTVNCFTYTHFDEAMDLARKAEAKYAKGRKTGALEGLPIGIKDESYIKGKPTSNGSLIYKDYIGTHTSPMNERILKEGQANLIGVGREIMHNPNWPLDAAQKLGVAGAFDQVPQQTGYWLAARARRGFGCAPSTWQAGLGEGTGQARV